jgi:hypothetical protein
MRAAFANDEIPYFSWDRSLTVAQIREELRMRTGREGVRLASWMMREAATPDVWQFLTPQEVDSRFAEIEPLLGRRRSFWKFIIQKWHELENSKAIC